MTKTPNSNDNNHDYSTSLNADAARYRDSLIAGAEELDFRTRQFLRAFHNPSPDAAILSQYASSLNDVLTHYAELINPYIQNETI